MAAISASFAAANQPRAVADVSTIDAYQTYTTSVSASTGDVIHFTNLKIPHGATIVGLKAKIGAGNDGTILAFGIAGGIVSAALFGSATASATSVITDRDNVVGGVLPYKVSLSDSRDTGVNYVYLTATVQDDGTATTSLSIGLRVTYTMNRTNAGGQ